MSMSIDGSVWRLKGFVFDRVMSWLEKVREGERAAHEVAVEFGGQRAAILRGAIQDVLVYSVAPMGPEWERHPVYRDCWVPSRRDKKLRKRVIKILRDAASGIPSLISLGEIIGYDCTKKYPSIVSIGVAVCERQLYICTPVDFFPVSTDFVPIPHSEAVFLTTRNDFVKLV